MTTPQASVSTAQSPVSPAPASHATGIHDRSDGHIGPFLVGVAIFAVSAIVSIILTGLPS
jgi:hypothetical protein